jgi:hypothetical protein
MLFILVGVAITLLGLLAIVLDQFCFSVMH